MVALVRRSGRRWPTRTRSTCARRLHAGDRAGGRGAPAARHVRVRGEAHPRRRRPAAAGIPGPRRRLRRAGRAGSWSSARWRCARRARAPSPAVQLTEEAARLREKLPAGSRVVVLARAGKGLSQRGAGEGARSLARRRPARVPRHRRLQRPRPRAGRSPPTRLEPRPAYPAARTGPRRGAGAGVPGLDDSPRRAVSQVSWSSCVTHRLGSDSDDS